MANKKIIFATLMYVILNIVIATYSIQIINDNIIEQREFAEEYIVKTTKYIMTSNDSIQ